MIEIYVLCNLQTLCFVNIVQKSGSRVNFALVVITYFMGNERKWQTL